MHNAFCHVSFPPQIDLKMRLPRYVPRVLCHTFHDAGVSRTPALSLRYSRACPVPTAAGETRYNSFPGSFSLCNFHFPHRYAGSVLPALSRHCSLPAEEYIFHPRKRIFLRSSHILSQSLCPFSMPWQAVFCFSDH